MCFRLKGLQVAQCRVPRALNPSRPLTGAMQPPRASPGRFPLCPPISFVLRAGLSDRAWLILPQALALCSSFTFRPSEMLLVRSSFARKILHVFASEIFQKRAQLSLCLSV